MYIACRVVIIFKRVLRLFGKKVHIYIKNPDIGQKIFWPISGFFDTDRDFFPKESRDSLEDAEEYFCVQSILCVINLFNAS